MTLFETAKQHIADLKTKGFIVCCWSTKENGGGKATEDCDIAIDVRGIHSEISVPYTSLVYNPYGKEPEHNDYAITRIKFNQNAEA